MSSYQKGEIYNNQDGMCEAGCYGDLTYEPLPVIKIRGNDTEDKECEVAYVGGCSFKLPKNTDCEIYMLSSGNDTTLKIAVMTPPKDKQRRWKEKTGGVQNPLDPEDALEFNPKRAQMVKNMFAVGKEGIFEVDGEKGDVYIRGRLVVAKEIVTPVRVRTPVVVAGGEPPPGFQNPPEQDKTSGGGGTA